MSWVFRRRRRPWNPAAVRFHVRRAAGEGWDPSRKPFFVDTPEYALVKVALAHPIRFEGFFYYRGWEEYTGDVVETARRAVERMGPDAAFEVLSAAREVGLSKDVPLMLAHILPGYRYAARLLESYPVPKLLLYLELARKAGLFGYGWRKRRAVVEALLSHGYEWHEHQAVKYRPRYRDVLRITRPAPPSGELEALWGWVVGRRPPPTGRVEAAERVMRREIAGDEAVRAAVKHGLPWELVRSNVRLGEVDAGLLEEAARRVMSGWDVAMQAGSLAARLGEGRVAEIARAKAHAIPASAAARAAVGLARRAPRLAGVFAGIARGKGGRVLDALGRALGYRDVVFVVDVSASMAGAPITAAARILLALGARRAFAFNSYYKAWVSLETVQDYAALLSLPRGGTPLYDAVLEAASTAPEGSLLVVVTDEQENESELGAGDVVRVLEERDLHLASIVVAPYPTSMLPKEAGSRIVGLPGTTPDAVIAASALLAANKAQTEGVAVLDFVERLGLLTRLAGNT